MPRARRAALLGGGVSVYADLNFAAARYKVGTSSAGDLTAIPGFSFTRASLAMGYDATGKLVYGPNNLCLQSQTLDNASWAKALVTVTANAATAPDGTLTADRFVSAGGSFPQIAQTCTVPAGNLVVSFWVQSDGTSQIAQAAIFDGVTVPFTPTSTWTQVIVSKTGSTGGSKALVIATNNGSAAASSFYIWGAQLEAVTYQTTPSTYYPTTTAAYYGPRLVYDPVTLASQGILVEEARTNLILQSQTFDNASWTKTSSTVTANAVTSPDGTTNADKIVSGAGVSNCRVQQVVTVAGTTVYTVSAFAKAAEWGWLAMRVAEDTAASVWFNISSGVVGTAETGWSGATITSIGGGWYRVQARYTTVGTSYTWRFIATNADGVASTGDGTSGIYLWQAQAELGTGASSPIPTTTASVTRAADVAAVTGLTVPNPHSMAAEWTPGFDTASGFRRAASLTNAGFTSEDAIYQRHTNNLVRAFTTTTMDNTLGTGNAATTNKAAARFELNNGTGSLNGAAVAAADTSTDPTTAINRLDIGQSAGAASLLNGTISRIRIYNRALSDAQLQSLTT